MTWALHPGYSLCFGTQCSRRKDLTYRVHPHSCYVSAWYLNVNSTLSSHTKDQYTMSKWCYTPSTIRHVPTQRHCIAVPPRQTMPTKLGGTRDEIRPKNHSRTSRGPVSVGRCTALPSFPLPRLWARESHHIDGQSAKMENKHDAAFAVHVVWTQITGQFLIVTEEAKKLTGHRCVAP